jgi:RNA polymerase subunit RPABC4/transcription elongation factor Spt4
MINLKTIRLFLRDWYQILICLLKTTLKSSIAKDLEIIALRSQLSLMQEQILNHKIPKPKPTPAFRQLLVLISKLCSNWRSFIMIVKPETVIGTRARAGIVPHSDSIGLENQNHVGDQKFLKLQLL